MKRVVIAMISILLLFTSTASAADSGNVWYSVVFPGWGQFKEGRYTRGTVFMGLGIVCLAGLGVANIQYDREVESYDRYKDLYLDADYIGDAVDAYAQMNEAWDNAEDLTTYRMAFGWAYVGIWAVSIVDMVVGPEAKEPALTLEVRPDAFYVAKTISF
jgi:hypothetical protein